MLHQDKPKWVFSSTVQWVKVIFPAFQRYTIWQITSQPAALSQLQVHLKGELTRGGRKDFQIAHIQTSVSPGVAHNASSFQASEEIAHLIEKAFKFKCFLHLSWLYYEYRSIFTH